MKRLFIEAPAFSGLVRRLRITDERVSELQRDVMSGLGDTIPGTGGIRKIRWALPGGGKRGGWRVLYADYDDLGITMLLAAYSKSVKETLTQSEAREWKRIKHLLDQRIRVRYGGKKEQ